MTTGNVERNVTAEEAALWVDSMIVNLESKLEIVNGLSAMTNMETERRRLQIELDVMLYVLRTLNRQPAVDALVDLLRSIKIKGPDDDGQTWIIIGNGIINATMRGTMVPQILGNFELDRAAALAAYEKAKKEK